MGISETFATAVSGLQANANKFRVAASNVVNANSDGYTAKVASTLSQSPSGVATHVSQSDQPVDVASEFINMIEARIGYGANAQVIETTRGMSGSLLNLVA